MSSLSQYLGSGSFQPRSTGRLSNYTHNWIDFAFDRFRQRSHNEPNETLEWAALDDLSRFIAINNFTWLKASEIVFNWSWFSPYDVMLISWFCWWFRKLHDFLVDELCCVRPERHFSYISNHQFDVQCVLHRIHKWSRSISIKIWIHPRHSTLFFISRESSECRLTSQPEILELLKKKTWSALLSSDRRRRSLDSLSLLKALECHLIMESLLSFRLYHFLRIS